MGPPWELSNWGSADPSGISDVWQQLLGNASPTVTAAPSSRHDWIKICRCVGDRMCRLRRHWWCGRGCGRHPSPSLCLETWPRRPAWNARPARDSGPDRTVRSRGPAWAGRPGRCEGFARTSGPSWGRWQAVRPLVDLCVALPTCNRGDRRDLRLLLDVHTDSGEYERSVCARVLRHQRPFIRTTFGWLWVPYLRRRSGRQPCALGMLEHACRSCSTQEPSPHESPPRTLGA